jgi:hypothetical protein
MTAQLFESGALSRWNIVSQPSMCSSAQRSIKSVWLRRWVKIAERQLTFRTRRSYTRVNFLLLATTSRESPISGSSDNLELYFEKPSRRIAQRRTCPVRNCCCRSRKVSNAFPSAGDRTRSISPFREWPRYKILVELSCPLLPEPCGVQTVSHL